MKFKIMSVKNAEGFCHVLDHCKGRVELVSPEGDCLNLKSKLTQFLTLSIILGSVSELQNLELYIEDANDASRLLTYVAGEHDSNTKVA